MLLVRYHPITGDRIEYDERKPPPGLTISCPCCHYLTIHLRENFEICPVCFWEDDGQDDADSDTTRGGPNGDLSLSQARENYGTFGACEQSMLPNVRPPHDVEKIKAC